VILIAACALFFIINPARIYLGYMANITESLPHIASFLFLSIFPTIVVALIAFLPNFFPDSICQTGADDIRCRPYANTMAQGIQVHIYQHRLKFLIDARQMHHLLKFNSKTFDI
jgi:hypothetical protein